uniref:Uncharacterized protein n=1 Tax=Parascaris equorum TaxID=6256 RepID=A0A914R4J0_PAREQ
MSRIGLFGQISVITEHLYLSGAGVLKPEKLKQKQITCVINAAVEEPNTYIPGNTLILSKSYTSKIKNVCSGHKAIHSVAGVMKAIIAHPASIRIA